MAQKEQETRLDPIIVATDQVVDGITVFDVTTDLTVEKKSSSNSVATSSAYSYTITVTNNGASDATNIIVTDTLPTDVSFVNATTTAPVQHVVLTPTSRPV